MWLIWLCKIRALFAYVRVAPISISSITYSLRIYLLHFNRAISYNVLKNNKVFSMNIITVPFEESLFLTVEGETVQIIAFKTQEHGNIKFGVQAPRSINVHREEIYHAIKQKQQAEVE